MQVVLMSLLIRRVPFQNKFHLKTGPEFFFNFCNHKHIVSCEFQSLWKILAVFEVFFFQSIYVKMIHTDWHLLGFQPGRDSDISRASDFGIHGPGFDIPVVRNFLTKLFTSKQFQIFSSIVKHFFKDKQFLKLDQIYFMP